MSIQFTQSLTLVEESMNSANDFVNNSKKTEEEKKEFIKTCMTEAINLSSEKCQISERCLANLTHHIEKLEKEIEEFSRLNQLQKPQNTFMLESLAIPALPDDNDIEFIPEVVPLRPGTSNHSRRINQHSENLKNLKSGALKSYPEKDMHSHVFNHTPEQEGMVRGNSTTTRAIREGGSTKKTEKETPSLVSIRTSSGSIMSVPSDQFSNISPNLASLSVDLKKQKRQNKQVSSSQEASVPVNISNITRKDSQRKASTSEAPALAETKIPKKDSQKRKTVEADHLDKKKTGKGSGKTTRKAIKPKEPVVAPVPLPPPPAEVNPEDLIPYCYCHKNSLQKDDEMVGCDGGESCPFGGWIHMSCLGPDENPHVDHFFCRECIKGQQTKKRKK